MGTTTPLLDRINRNPPSSKRPIELRRTPAWIRRMNQHGLPDKDMTLYNGAFVPRGSGGAA